LFQGELCAHYLNVLGLTRPDSEKENLIEKAKQIITAIRQLESSLEDTPEGQNNLRGDSLQVTLPLLSCLHDLEDKHNAIRRLHQERFEEVKSMDFERDPIVSAAR